MERNCARVKSTECKGLDEIIRGRHGRPASHAAKNHSKRGRAKNVGINQEVEQLTQKVRGTQLIIVQFQDLHPPNFFDNKSGERVAGWLKSINHLFNLLEYSQGFRLKLAIYQLKDHAQLWWEATQEALKESGKIITCEVFRAQFTQ